MRDLGEKFIKFFKLYSILLILLASSLVFTPSSFKYLSKNRYPASDSCAEIMAQLIETPVRKDKIHSNVFDAYQTKNNLWNKILSTQDFESFDETLYFRSLELYTNEKNFAILTPTTIEEKMALIEVIQNQYAYFIGVPSLKEELATLSTKKLKKIFNLVQKFDPSSAVARENLHNFASELFILQKGPPVALIDYFTENKTARMSRRLYRIAQEELLLKGLNNVIMQFPEKTRYSLKDKAQLYVNRIIRTKIFRLSSLPLDLPFIDQVKLPDELLEKILLEGINAHSEELITHFRKINMIDHYERFRKVYRTVAFGVTFAYFYEETKSTLRKDIDDKEQQDKQNFLDNFKKLATIITSEATPEEKTDQEIKNQQLKRVLDTFRAKYHEDPTPSELQEIKNKIYGH